MMIDRLSMVDHFGDLQDVSELVSAYLNDEQYQHEFSNISDYTARDLLRTCYGILLLELQDMGIMTIEEPEDITKNFYDCKFYYYLKLFLSPNELIRYITVSKDLLDIIEDIVENTENNPFVFQDILTNIHQFNSSNEIFDILQIIQYDFTTDERFITYFKQILALIHQGDLEVNITNLDRANRYISKIANLRKYAREAVYKIVNQTPDIKIDMVKLEKLLSDYDRDKLTPDEIKIYSLVDLDEVPECLKAYKEMKMLIHHQRSPHHAEYWVAPYKQPLPQPTIENLILIVAHHSEPDTTSKTFWEEMETTIKMLQPAFTPNQIEFMLDAGKILFPKENKEIEKYGIFNI